MKRFFTGLVFVLAFFGTWVPALPSDKELVATPDRRVGFVGAQTAQRDFRPCEPNCGIGGAGQRVEEPGGASHFFRSADQNGDGKVSREEFTGPPPAFGLMDANSDGFVSREEFAAFQKSRQSGDTPSRSAPTSGPNLPVVTTHTHILAATDRGNQDMDWPGATKNALAQMDKFGIRTAVIMPTPMNPDRSDESLIDGFFQVARAHPGRFVVVGGGESLNGMIHRTPPDQVTERLRQRFTKRAEELIRRGAVGFGEMTALHFSLFRGHPFEQTRPDHPLFLLLADLAAKHDVPIDLHVEAVRRDWPVSDELSRRSNENPERISENITALERLLSHNRRARIIWVHVGADFTGQRSVDLTRRLLRENANLLLSITSHQFAMGEDWFFKPSTGLNPRWHDLILEFPDRFMIGTDVFFQPDNALRKMPNRMQLALGVLTTSELPPEVKRKVAFENAQRVFKLKGPETPAPAVAATARARQAPALTRFLDEAEIRRTVIGNTLNFNAPSNGQNTFVYFAKDGATEIKVGSQDGAAIRKRWFFNARGLLCRTVGKQDRNHCTRVQSSDGPSTLTLLNQKVRYQATVLPGRKFTR